jgi:Peptidase S24-like
MDNKEIRLTNLLALVDEAGSKTELARRVGTNANYLTQITTGHRSVGDDLARDLEKGMSKAPGWLDHVHGDAVPAVNVRRIPLFDTAAICEVSETPSAFVDLANAARGSVLSDLITSEHAYAMRVESDAMQNKGAGPSFPMGSRVVVDPDIEARSGAIVLAKFTNDDLCLRRFIVEGKRRYLVPLNDAYDVIDLPADARICGVAVQVISDVEFPH